MSDLKLHDYQRTAVAHLRANPRAGLLLDMGLGKTAVCLSALRPEDLPALVVAPKRVAEEVWDVEGEKWRPDLKVGRAVGTPAQRAAVLTDRSYDVVTIGTENIKDAALEKRQWTTFIIDELSGYKGRGARWKAARKLIMRGDMENVWGLTGTPSPNSLMDLYGQLYLLDGGKRLGRTLTAYRERHFTPGRRLPTGVIIEWLLRDGHDKMIHQEIEDICLSMAAKDYLDLPEVTFNEVHVPLSKQSMKLYQQIKDTLVLDLTELGIGDYIHTAPTAAALSNRLSQVNAGFIYEDRESAEMAGRAQGISWLHTDRVKAVREIVEGTGGSPVLLSYRYKPELEMLKKEFGDDLHTVKSPNVFKRWNKGQVPILAAHPGSIGHGLNLQFGGHTVVWMSPTWNLEHWDQFNARLPRQGQQHPVVVHMLSSPGTIDPRVYHALRTKSKVQKALLDHLKSPV